MRIKKIEENKYLAELNYNYKTYRKVFSTEKDAHEWLTQKKLELTQQLPKFSTAELLDIIEAKKILPPNVSLIH